MARKERFSASEKLNAIEDYISGKRGISQICRDMQTYSDTFYVWLNKYKMYGVEGLITVKKNKHYPDTLKIQAVKDYLDGKSSLRQICTQYEISSKGILQQWIKKYNGHKIFKSHDLQGDNFMAKGRKTTFEERIEIVSFCIANNYDYQIASDKFNVSYQQVYTWTKKYEINGSEALLDGRGKRKHPQEMDENQKLAAKLKLIEAENKRLKLENDFLKKLDEIERRR